MERAEKGADLDLELLRRTKDEGWRMKKGLKFLLPPSLFLLQILLPGPGHKQ
jgi:hypothetical protein